jgi:hypothetical protein
MIPYHMGVFIGGAGKYHKRSIQPKLDLGLASIIVPVDSQNASGATHFFFFFFSINILYRDRIYYMYHAL